MLFKKVMIKDFRPYYQLQEISFEISEKNITLIKAENGTGKTTLLEALKWCFYGNNLNLPNKSEFVNEKAISEVKIGDTIDVFIEVYFEENRHHYKINRTKCFRKTKDGMVPVEEIFQLKNESNDTIFEGNIAQNKVRQLLPEELNFFIDGERLVKIENKTEKIRAVENILGIKAYKNAQSDLEKVIKEYNRKIMEGSKSNDRYIKLLKEKESYEEKKEKIKNEIENYEAEVVNIHHNISKKNEDMNLLIAEIKNKGEIGAKLGLLIEKEKKVKEEKTLLFLSYKDKLSKKMPYLVGSELIKKAYDILEGRRKEGKIPSNIKGTLIDDLLKARKCICGNHITEKEEKILIDLKSEAVDIEDENEFYKIYNKVKVDKNIDISLLSDIIKESEIKYQAKEKELNDLEIEIHNLSEIYTENDKENIEKKKDLENAINDSIRQLGIKEGYIESNNKQLEELNKKIFGLATQINNEVKMIRNNEFEKSKKMSEKLLEVLNVLYDAKLKREREALNRKIKNIYAKVTRKGYIIELDEKFNLRVFKENIHNNMEVALSTGENKMVTLCFIGGLVSLARDIYRNQKDFEAGGGIFPIVLDSPYGDLDNEHKLEMTNIIHELSDQIIIFASSSQWSVDVENIMKDRVGKTYKLVNKNTKNSTEKYEFTKILQDKGVEI